jgi:hypothetical protein
LGGINFMFFHWRFGSLVSMTTDRDHVAAPAIGEDTARAFSRLYCFFAGRGTAVSWAVSNWEDVWTSQVRAEQNGTRAAITLVTVQ